MHEFVVDSVPVLNSPILLSAVFLILILIIRKTVFIVTLLRYHDIVNLFSLWAASIDKHIASLAARHCAFFLSLHLLVSLCIVDNKN